MKLIIIRAVIPAFPQFRPLSLAIASEYQNHIASYPPYADFNLINRIAWDLNDTSAVSLLHGNLVLQLPNYSRRSTRLTLIGSCQLDRTIGTLLAYAQSELGIAKLELVPEYVVRQLSPTSAWLPQEDVDSHDHVLSMKRLAIMDSSELRHYRRAIRIFLHRNESVVSFHRIDVSCRPAQEAMLSIFLRREAGKQKNNPGYELLALQRLFKMAERLPLKSYGISIHGILRAFIICEQINNTWAIGHFWKADTDFTGVYSYLMHCVADCLQKQGIEFLNTQQDLGIPGLRSFKQSLAPVMQLRKYTLQPTAAQLGAAPMR